MSLRTVAGVPRGTAGSLRSGLEGAASARIRRRTTGMSASRVASAASGLELETLLRVVPLAAQAGCSWRMPSNIQPFDDCAKYETVDGCVRRIAAFLSHWSAEASLGYPSKRRARVSSPAGPHLAKLPFAAPGLAPLKELALRSRGSPEAGFESGGGGYPRGDRSSQACCSAFVPLALSASDNAGWTRWARRCPCEGSPVFHVDPRRAGGPARRRGLGPGSIRRRTNASELVSRRRCTSIWRLRLRGVAPLLAGESARHCLNTQGLVGA